LEHPHLPPTRPWGRLIFGTFAAGNSMVLALALNMSEVTAAERRSLTAALSVATLIVVVLLGTPLFSGIFRSIRSRRISIELLFALGIMGALGVSFLSVYRSMGPVFFEVVSILLVVYRLGNEAKTGAQARFVGAVRAAFASLRYCEIVTTPDDEAPAELRPIDDILPGDLVRCHPGEVIPVDGIVTKGVGFVRASAITGEPLAVARGPGDAVHAGSDLIDATLLVRASRAGDQRCVDRLLRLIAQAGQRPSRTERAADRIAAWFVPCVATASLVTFVLWTILAGVERGLWTGLAVLLVACPCALGFATPVAMWTALMRLGALGIVARRGDAIEDLAAIDTAVFDKTGTLTDAVPTLREFRLRDGSAWHSDDLTAMAAAVEVAVRHPIGNVFGRPGAGAAVAAVATIPGVGVTGSVRRDGAWHHVTVGSADALAATCCQRNAVAALRGAGRRWADDHELAILIGGRVEALAWVGESPRAGIDVLRARLSEMGIDCHVLSGDCQARVERLGFADAVGDLAPEHKLARLQALTSEGRVPVYIGDGLNDLGGMSAATVTIGVEGGARGVSESTDLLWDGRDLCAIPHAIAFCRFAVASLNTTLRFAVGYNLIGMALAAGGLIHPVVAALLMTGSSGFVTWRAARMLAWTPTHARECAFRPI
jgi:cation transport ATPase